MIVDQWYIVCFERELRTGQPVHRKIVGEEIVVYRTRSGGVGVLEDRCCHRNVRLSLGKVCGEHIACGYHGWEYGRDGQCTRIPSLQDDQQIPRSARVRSYPVQVRHGAVWAYFGDPDVMDQASIPPLEQLDQWPFIFNYHELDGNIKLVAESLFDAQHINHVHRDSIGTMMGQLGADPVDFHITSDKRSLEGWYYRSNRRNLFEKIYFGFGKKLKTYFAFWFPHTSMLDLRFPAHGPFPARRMIIYEHFYEIEEGRCMMIQVTTWQRIFRFNPWFAKWFMSAKSNRIVEEDIAFLESNYKWHRQKELKDLFIPPDEVSLVFSKLWNNNLRNGTERPHTGKA